MMLAQVHLKHLSSYFVVVHYLRDLYCKQVSVESYTNNLVKSQYRL